MLDVEEYRDIEIEILVRRVTHAVTVIIIYIDFTKAYDLVSHQKLFVKLHSYGVRGNVYCGCRIFSLIAHYTDNKTLAIANRSRVSCAHNTSRAFIGLNITP